MAKFAAITEVMGNTPLIRLNRFSGKHLLAKFEGQSPSGCIYDRFVAWQCKQAKLRAGMQVMVDYADAFAISWAWMAVAHSATLVYAQDTATNNVTRKLLKALGARPFSTQSWSEKKSEILKVDEASFLVGADQAKISKWGCIQEICQELGDALEVLILPMISHSFIEEAVAYVAQLSPKTKLVFVALRNREQYRDWLLSSHQSPLERFSPFLRENDEVIEVDITIAIEAATHLARTEALLCDIESAAAAAVARTYRDTTASGYAVVVICSHGLRYIDQYYSIAARVENSLLNGISLPTHPEYKIVL